jgi:hypothetical protein
MLTAEYQKMNSVPLNTGICVTMKGNKMDQTEIKELLIEIVEINSLILEFHRLPVLEKLNKKILKTLKGEKNESEV